MSLASEGSVAENVGGQPGGAQSASENGSAGASGNSPWAGLQDADNRTMVEKKGWKSSDEALKSYRELESKVGSAITPPAADAPPEAWDKVYAKLGRPEKPDAYEFKRPNDLPEDLPYDETLAGGFKGWAHKAGLNGRQAQALHDQFIAYNAEQAKAHVTALSKSVETAAADLEKAWGPQQSESFKGNLAVVNHALKELGLKESFQKSGIILKDGALTDASLAKAFLEVGRQMFTEDKIDGVAAKAAGVNPFKKGSEHSVTGQSLAIKQDPKRAFQLAREAGHSEDQAHMLVYGHARK